MKFRLKGAQLLAALFFALTAFDLTAADRKQWEKLSECRYIPTEYGDGDSFRVSCGAREFVIRLYYIDAPETKLTGDKVREQRDYFNISLDDVLNIGNKTNDRVRQTLNKPFVVYTRWAGGGGRSKEPRYYALVEIDGKSLIEILVMNGLARIKGVKVNLPNGKKSMEYVEKLETLEKEAKRQKKGAWALSKR